MSKIKVTVEIGGHNVLILDETVVRVIVTSFDEQIVVADALARALNVFLVHQPPLSPMAIAADAVEKLSAAASPQVAREGLAAISEAITELRDRIEADTRQRSSH